MPNHVTFTCMKNSPTLKQIKSCTRQKAKIPGKKFEHARGKKKRDRKQKDTRFEKRKKACSAQ